MAYKVIAKFRDKDGAVYEVGDEYKGSKAKARLEELSTNSNRYGYPFIKEVKEPKKKDKKEAGE